MKKNLFLWAVLAVMTAFTACTQEKVVYVEMEEETENLNGIELKDGEGLIKISLSNSMSRAARPIVSNAATNNVNRIAFKFMSYSDELSGVTLEGVVDESGNAKDGFSVNEDGTVLCLPDNNSETSINVKFSSLPQSTTCTIIAYGYNCESGVYGFSYTITKTERSPYNLMCENIGEAVVEEIFAGYTENVVTNQYGRFTESPTITLTRQVAGLMAYLSNVPSSVENQTVNKITINTHLKVIGFNFPASMMDGTKKLLNGITPSSSPYGKGTVDLLTFTIPDGTSTDNKGYYKFNEDKGTGQKFLLADGMTESSYSDLRCKDNTLFGSCFILPFSGHVDMYTWEDDVDTRKSIGKATLNIIYWTREADGQYTPIKTVLLKTNNPPQNDGLSYGTGYSSADYQYDIRCNNFYSLGAKTLASDGGGIPDDDKPLEIDEPTGTMQATVTIDVQWTQSHDLTNRE